MLNGKVTNLWEGFTNCWKNYANFNGRARRKEYWGFRLFSGLIVIGFAILSGLLLAVMTLAGSWQGAIVAGMLFWILTVLFILATLIPCLAVTIRRLHDCEKPGWYILFMFMPLFVWLVKNSADDPKSTDTKVMIMPGWLYLFILYLTEGTRGQNQYGEDTK